MTAKKDTIKKGSACSYKGKLYELECWRIARTLRFKGNKFNTQNEHDLGGSSARNDLECNYENNQKVGIEIKKHNTPDWMQCSITFNEKKSCWEGSSKAKIPQSCVGIFNNLLREINLFDNKNPPFLSNNFTHEEWTTLKSSTELWNDCYFDIPKCTIASLYARKNNSYIQISGGFGLYHLGEDTYNFGVPMFCIDQQLRIRIKVHTRKNTAGYCKLSVMAACQPKRVKSLVVSPYSLDNWEKLPKELRICI